MPRPGAGDPLRAAIDAMRDQVVVLDAESLEIIDANLACERANGYGREELLGRRLDHFMPMSEADALRFRAAVRDAGEAGLRAQLRVQRKSGVPTVLEAEHVRFESEGRAYIVTSARDIRLRVQQEASNERLRNMFAALSSTNEAILLARSAHELFTRVCQAARSGGYKGAAVYLAREDRATAYVAASSGPAHSPLNQVEVVLDEGRAGSDNVIARVYRHGTPLFIQDIGNEAVHPVGRALLRQLGLESFAALPIRQRDRCLGVLTIGSVERGAFDDEIKGLLLRMADNIAFGLNNIAALEDRQLAEARANHLANHDALTGLPNRMLFNELLVQALHAARRQQSRLAVMFLDLDRFKVINDSLGHSAGDALLREMAQRLRRTLRSSDVVARLGGDEFVILLPQVVQRAEAASVARKVLEAVLEPVEIEGHECRLSASIGVCMYPDTAQDEHALMSNADAAMYRAKQSGKNNVQFFTRASRSVGTHQLTMESQLRGALENDEFALVYQTRQELRTGVVTGVEALLRWHNPQLGLVMPAELLPLAEEIGLMEDIGRWVLRTACAQNVAWQRAGLRRVNMAVNLSAGQFLARGIVRDIDEALRATGMDPKLLELEITEGMVVQNPVRAREILVALKARGIRVAIDDFGTGYSSLGQLRNFPIDTLKVDRSFIAEMTNDAEDRAITEAIIAMGRTLSLTVVAEGVETPEQAAFLRAHACDEVQGFYFGRPLPPDQVAGRLVP